MHFNIEGLKVTELEKKEGEFSSIYKISKLGYPIHENFEEIYCSHLYANVVRGWYKHTVGKQNMTVIKGSVNFVIYDDRQGSITRGNVVEININPENFTSLHIPAELWYAFGSQNSEDAYIINCLPLSYEEMSSEFLPIDSVLIPYAWK